MKKYLLIATALVALASCSDDTFVGENSPNTNDTYGGDIKFGLTMQNQTRGDIYGKAAADLLGSHFYVMGTKGTGTGDEVEPATTPTTDLVFDNYLVHYGVNTAGKTESNTANWEYVGVQPKAGDYTNYEYLTSASRTAAPQTIKYWDYSTKSYDFFAFSTGPNNAVSNTSPAAGNIGVTNMKYGTNITSGATVYTLYVPTVEDLAETYITDIIKVAKSNYGKEVQLKFKNVGSKVRIALYETVPGYSVKEVKFYKVDAGASPSDLGSGTQTAAYLIGASGDTEYSFPTAGQIDVAFAHVGANNKSLQAYDKATATVTATAGSEKFKSFDNLNYTGKDPNGFEEDDDIYLGRTLPDATFAGSAAADYYKTVFPVTTCYPLTLRVDYTLVSTDGSGEEIKVYGAKAVVPATYTRWLPNYAYTYIFKISDNTNGWTDTDHTAQGLFPITFDAVVTEATDVTGEQTTITTVATPTITTYQQNHNPNKDGKKITTDEYSKATGKNIYVQVMDNSTASATLKTDLNGKTPEKNAKSLLYKLDNDDATEAIVMDALENRTAAYAGDASTITGRNRLGLTKQTISNTVTSIVNGVDNNPIGVTAGEAAMIQITGDGALATGTYAYVYDYTTVESPATKRAEITEFQPIVPGVSHVESASSTKKFATITIAQLNAITPEASAVDLNASDAMNYLYFSKTTNGSGTTTYSYISVVGKTSLPAKVVKILKSDAGSANGTDTPDGSTFYFDKYYSNNGKYAVKVIKVVN